MKSCFVFLFALGLASATETTIKKLNVLGKLLFLQPFSDVINIYLRFIDDTVSSSDNTPPNDRMNNEQQIGRDVKGSGCDLI
jgi:hypothetical protein